MSKVTYEMLAKIYEIYNPLGGKHSFLVNDFLVWSQKEREFYWIWAGKGDPKAIIKELPFTKEVLSDYSDYKDLLVGIWLRFLNSDEKLAKTIEDEYKFLLGLPF
jgi:hypothetical protein